MSVPPWARLLRLRGWAPASAMCAEPVWAIRVAGWPLVSAARASTPLRVQGPVLARVRVVSWHDWQSGFANALVPRLASWAADLGPVCGRGPVCGGPAGRVTWCPQPPGLAG